jgi:uncharacterized membrane protein
VLWPFALYGAFVPPSREGRFVRFHARQALVFDLAMTTAVAVLLFVPLIGPAIAVLVPIPWAALSVMWAVKAYAGERAEMGVFHSIGRRWIEQ